MLSRAVCVCSGRRKLSQDLGLELSVFTRWEENALKQEVLFVNAFFSILRREKKFIYFPLLSKLEWNCWSIICPCLEVDQFHFNKCSFSLRLLMSHFLSVLPSFLPSTNIYWACSVCLKYFAKSWNKTGSCLHGTYTLWGDIDISQKKKLQE